MTTSSDSGLFGQISSINYYCTAIRFATITSIGDYAFYYCYSLTSIVIPNSVTSISSNAFNSCYSLTSISIPNSVTSIGDYAFTYCHSLTKYDFSQCSGVPTLPNKNVFNRFRRYSRFKGLK